MPRKPHISNRYLLLGDLFFIVVSVFASYALRLDIGPVLMFYLPSALWMIGISLVVKPLVYYTLGLYRRMWMYASMRELKLIAIAVTVAEIPVFMAMISLLSLNIFRGMPRTALVIDWLLSLIFVGGLRFSVRLWSESVARAQAARQGQTRRVLIVGAGDAGALVVRELQKNPQLNLEPIGFLDDNPAKLRQQIYGIPVIGTLEDLAETLERRRVDEVVIAIPSAPGRVVRLVADACRGRGVPFRTIPGIYELLGGKVSVNRLREVDITDLLRRQPTQLKEELMGQTLNGRIVLVTGGGGSIGRELCRQIARWGPSMLILMGHGENSVFEAVLDLQENFPSLLVKPVIADVRDQPRLQTIFSQYHPQVVFHAAAHKHVPLMELNVEDAITNNVMGTRNLVETALDYGVERLVMISTDKAIRPANVMGATKRLAEMLVLDAARRTGKPFSVVRFGNVLGSRGSVVPKFKRQIARGGPVTITHPDMERFFMTIPEAVYLVLQAAGMSNGCETFVLNMGQPVRIQDLAEDLIRLSGLEPGRDIEITYTGIRLGEKLSEQLWEEGDILEPTEHPEILRLMGQTNLQDLELQTAVDDLIELARSGDAPAIIATLDRIIPGAMIRSTPPSQIESID
ncbi:MAG TPA: nucleoside-diphosphate sugar epimerase/dehydratase [Anaerolineaceae bacterium]|nr:nucleoside-diphosphate sugar epimerase/dehydratase [Anaerolineaceae bacterium]